MGFFDVFDPEGLSTGLGGASKALGRIADFQLQLRLEKERSKREEQVRIREESRAEIRLREKEQRDLDMTLKLKDEVLARDKDLAQFKLTLEAETQLNYNNPFMSQFLTHAESPDATPEEKMQAESIYELKKVDSQLQPYDEAHYAVLETLPPQIAASFYTNEVRKRTFLTDLETKIMKAKAQIVSWKSTQEAREARVRQGEKRIEISEERVGERKAEKVKTRLEKVEDELFDLRTKRNKIENEITAGVRTKEVKANRAIIHGYLKSLDEYTKRIEKLDTERARLEGKERETKPEIVYTEADRAEILTNNIIGAKVRLRNGVLIKHLGGDIWDIVETPKIELKKGKKFF